jgi:ribonuclease Z
MSIIMNAIPRFLRLLLVTIATVPASAQSARNTGEPDISLTFLGTGAPRPSLKRYGPGILVETDKHRLLVDAGSGLRERVYQAGAFDLLTSIDHILVTHLHYDHTIGISDIWLSGWLYGRRVPLRVQGPPGLKAMMDELARMYTWDIGYRAAVGVPLQGTEIRAEDVLPGVIYEHEGLKVTAFDVEHMPIDIKTREPLDFSGRTYGFRIDYRGRSVVFSGDTRPSENLVKFGRGADVLIHEVQVPAAGTTPEAQLANVSLSVHSTPEQAAGVFKRAAPRLAVYSHIIPPGATREELMARTRPTYDGPLTVAHDLMQIDIGDRIEIRDRELPGEVIFEETGVLKRPKPGDSRNR